MALYDGARVDFARLRRERRERVLDAMRERDLDVLIFGREPNAQYVSGVRRLHLAGTRPWGPGCVVVRERDAVHVMSVWDDGIPPEIPHDHLYGIGWNPMNLVASVQKIEGVSSARRIGVDYMSPLFQQLLPMAAPDAQLVNAEALMRSVRMRKTADEVACITTAVAIAEAALTASVDNLHPGVNGKLLLAAFMSADDRVRHHHSRVGRNVPRHRAGLARRDARIPPAHHRRAHRRGRVGRGVGWRPLLRVRGQHRTDVALHRHARPRHPSIPTRAPPSVERRLAAGARPRVVKARRAPTSSTPTPRPGSPIRSSRSRPAWVLGPRGRSRSALGRSFDATRRIEAGMVMNVQAYVADEAGGYFGLETVHVTEDGAVRLSTMTHGPLAEIDPDD